jgi:F-type H+-transporting ATPase subunit epsilon
VSDLNVSLVTPDREIFSGTASVVIARTSEGEIGIGRDHEPVMALLAEGGVVRIDTTDNQKIVAAVHGGFLSVDSNNVTILGQVAELASDIDVTRARAALERARQTQDDRAAAAARRAEARLQAAGIMQ